MKNKLKGYIRVLQIRHWLYIQTNMIMREVHYNIGDMVGKMECN